MTTLPQHSARAAARLEQDLPALRAIVVQTARRRQVGLAAAIVASITLALLSAAITLRADDAPLGSLPVTPRHASVALPSAPAQPIRIQTIEGATPSAIVELDDAGLREALTHAGRPDGLIRIAGRTHLSSELFAMQRPTDPPPP